MHFIVMRRELHDREPWLAANIIAAFEAAKDGVMSDPTRRAELEAPIEGTTPEEWAEIVGPDPWAYGLEPNRKVIETFLRYGEEEGLVTEHLRIDDLFVTV